MYYRATRLFFFSFSSTHTTCYLFRTQPLTLMYSSSPRCTEPAAVCLTPSLSHCLWSSRTLHPGCYNPLTNTYSTFIRIYKLQAVQQHMAFLLWHSQQQWWWWQWMRQRWFLPIYTHDGANRKYSQLSSCRVHTCLSMGYLVRSMLHAIVAVMLLGFQNKSFRNGLKTWM